MESNPSQNEANTNKQMNTASQLVRHRSHHRRTSSTVNAERLAALNKPEETRSLKGQVAVVTGASKGIGRAISIALAKEGCKLVLISAHSTNLLSEVAQDCIAVGAETVFELNCDITSDKSVDDTVNIVRERFGKVHILINNAGIGGKGQDSLWEDWKHVIEVDLLGVMRMTNKSLPIMSSPGTIINIGSVAGKNSFSSSGYHLDYAASKAGVGMFSYQLFEMVRDLGIKVCVICPGYVETQMVRKVPLDHSRFIDAEDIARAVLFVVKFPDSGCPVEIVLRPQKNPKVLKDESTQVDLEELFEQMKISNTDDDERAIEHVPKEE